MVLQAYRQCSTAPHITIGILGARIPSYQRPWGTGHPQHGAANRVPTAVHSIRDGRVTTTTRLKGCPCRDGPFAQASRPATTPGPSLPRLIAGTGARAHRVSLTKYLLRRGGFWERPTELRCEDRSKSSAIEGGVTSGSMDLNRPAAFALDISETSISGLNG